MRKLYNHTKGKIHPSPPPSTTPDHHLSLLPFAIATLAATLPPQDQQVLAYLLSISTAGKPINSAAGVDHPPQFNCNCFRCYTTFWVRWDASPNRKVIHEIIDAYEDGLIHNKKNGKNKKERKNNKSSSDATSSICLHAPAAAAEEIAAHEPVEIEKKKIGDEGEMGVGSSEKGSVRKIVNFIGERIWGVWGI
ncbi:hypothetical protein L1987_31744 [Smallanthus sonchifolius]|uniref:Uncharacterized protein n=1 Tax=Smallanthus sonchifolius TaxID=185202 RepID=A0ACB9I5S9_9ASTR|nr:hypothetical protein L1987_31744 [Smallanthus sonchifolius]